MNYFTQWIPEPVLQAFGQAMMHSLWQGALLALLLAVALWLLRAKPAIYRYWAGMFTLFLFGGLFIGTGVYEYGVYSKQLSEASNTIGGPVQIVIDGEIGGPATISPLQEPFIEFQGYFEAHAPLFVGIWAMGACLFALRLLGSYLYAQRLKVYRTRKVEGEWKEHLQHIAEKMGITRQVQLLESALAESPMTIGYWKPVVLLPLGMLSGMPPEQIEAILAHELAHIRRHDYLLNILQSIMETILFYHPATWWISGLIREEREHACDDLALVACGNQLAFARALTNIEEGNFRLPYLAMTWARKQGALLLRIKRILGEPAKQFHLPEHLVVASLMLLAICSLAFQRPTTNIDFDNAPELLADMSFGPETSMVAEATASAWSYAVSDTTKKKNRKKKKKNKKNGVEEGSTLKSEIIIKDGDEDVIYTIEEKKEGTGVQYIYKIQGDDKIVVRDYMPNANGKGWYYITSDTVFGVNGQRIVVNDTVESRSIRVISPDVDVDTDFEMSFGEVVAPDIDVDVDLDESVIVKVDSGIDPVVVKVNPNFVWATGLDSPFVVINGDSIHIDSLTKVEMKRVKLEMENVHEEMEDLHKEMEMLHKEMAKKQKEMLKEANGKRTEEMKKAMKEMELEMKERKLEMEERRVEIQERVEEMSERRREREERVREQAERREQMRREIKVQRQVEYQKFWSELKESMVKDGLLQKEEKPVQIFLSNQVLRINGKDASKAEHKKYLKMIKEHFKHEEGNMSLSISEDQTQIMISLED